MFFVRKSGVSLLFFCGKNGKKDEDNRLDFCEGIAGSPIPICWAHFDGSFPKGLMKFGDYFEGGFLMKKLYQGKTKDVFQLDDEKVLLKFKDDVTGENGVFDPGANTVGLSIEGMGQAGLRMSTYFFELLKENGIETHYISSDIPEATMTVVPASIIGKGVEVICRYRAVGSFMRRYGLYATDGQPLDAYVELTLKDDDRNDPLITKEGLVALNIMTAEEYDAICDVQKKICNILKADLEKRGLDLYDIKLEYGRSDNGVVVIDEISGGNMRVYKDGEIVLPLDLAKMVLEN